MRKLKAIWRLIWSSRWIAYGDGRIDCSCIVKDAMVVIEWLQEEVNAAKEEIKQDEAVNEVNKILNQK